MQETMRDPVTASDGYSYERRALLAFMARTEGDTLSPMTQEVRHAVCSVAEV